MDEGTNVTGGEARKAKRSREERFAEMLHDTLTEAVEEVDAVEALEPQLMRQLGTLLKPPQLAALLNGWASAADGMPVGGGMLGGLLDEHARAGLHLATKPAPAQATPQLRPHEPVGQPQAWTTLEEMLAQLRQVLNVDQGTRGWPAMIAEVENAAKELGYEPDLSLSWNDRLRAVYHAIVL